jgi:5'-methylthioadenosine phosphorylase
MIISNLVHNAAAAQKVIAEAVARLPAVRGCACATALQSAIITRPDRMPDSVKAELLPIIGKYVK